MNASLTKPGTRCLFLYVVVIWMQLWVILTLGSESPTIELWQSEFLRAGLFAAFLSNKLIKTVSTKADKFHTAVKTTTGSPLELIYEHSGNFIYSTKNTIPGHLKTLVNTARDISLTNVYCLWRDIYKNRPCYLCYRIQTPAKPGLKLFQIVWLKICFWNFCLLFFYRFKTIMFFHKLLLKAEIKQYILDYSIGKQ